MTTTLVNHTLLRTPFFQFYFGFLVFTMRLVLLSTIYIFTDVKSVSVYFFVLRFICLSFSHFDSLLCCCHLTTFNRYSQNTTDWYEMCVCGFSWCAFLSIPLYIRFVVGFQTRFLPLIHIKHTNKLYLLFRFIFFLLSLLLQYFILFFRSYLYV